MNEPTETGSTATTPRFVPVLDGGHTTGTRNASQATQAQAWMRAIWVAAAGTSVVAIIAIVAYQAPPPQWPGDEDVLQLFAFWPSMVGGVAGAVVAVGIINWFAPSFSTKVRSVLGLLAAAPLGWFGFFSAFLAPTVLVRDVVSNVWIGLPALVVLAIAIGALGLVVARQSLHGAMVVPLVATIAGLSFGLSPSVSQPERDGFAFGPDMWALSTLLFVFVLMRPLAEKREASQGLSYRQASRRYYLGAYLLTTSMQAGLGAATYVTSAFLAS